MPSRVIAETMPTLGTTPTVETVTGNGAAAFGWPTGQSPSTPSDRNIVARFLDRANLAGKSVLSIGCETDDVTFRCVDAGAKVVAIDRSKSRLSGAEARARHSRDAAQISFRQSAPDALPFAADAFDLTVSKDVLSAREFDRAIAEISRVTRADGTAILIESLVPPHDRNSSENPVSAARHGLSRDEVDRVRAHFGLVEVHCIEFLSAPLRRCEASLAEIDPRLAAPVAPIARALDAADAMLMRLRPFRRLASRIVLVMTRPRIHESA